MSRQCITHHHACDCRERKFAELEAENKRLTEAQAGIMDNWIDIMSSGEGVKYNKGYNQALLDTFNALKEQNE